MITDLKTLIAKEQAYFQPMLARQSAHSLEKAKAYRQETVYERKERVSKEVFDLCQGKVQYGPFKGMQLQENTWWGKYDLGSMCLGLYEKEIQEALFAEEVLGRKNFIDIGAADGYYAIGMLHSQRCQQAICFEITSTGRQTIEQNWHKNFSPGKLAIYGDVFQDFEQASSQIDFSDSMVLIDIEGQEFQFLNTQTLQMLKDAVIIIEIHNWSKNFLEQYTALLERCNQYFTIEVIERMERTTLTLPELRDFTDDNRLLLTSESRPCVMRFLRLIPN